MFWEHVGKWKGLIVYRLYGSVYDLQIPWDIEFFHLRTSRTLPICSSKLWNCKNKTKQNRVCSMWQTSNQRALCKTSEKTLIFWSSLWEPHTGFQPPSVSSSQEGALRGNRKTGFRPISRRVFLTHFSYVSGSSMTKLFFEENFPWPEKGFWKYLWMLKTGSQCQLFSPLALLLLRLSDDIFGMKPHSN